MGYGASDRNTCTNDTILTNKIATRVLWEIQQKYGNERTFRFNLFDEKKHGLDTS